MRFWGNLLKVSWIVTRGFFPRGVGGRTEEVGDEG